MLEWTHDSLHMQRITDVLLCIQLGNAAGLLLHSISVKPSQV